MKLSKLEEEGTSYPKYLNPILKETSVEEELKEPVTINNSQNLTKSSDYNKIHYNETK